MKDNETDEELYARVKKASKEAKKWVARYAHVKEPPGISMMVGPQTKEAYEAVMASLQKPRTKPIKPKGQMPMSSDYLSKEDQDIIKAIDRARPEARRRAVKAASNIKKQVEQALAEEAAARAKKHKDKAMR